MLRACWNLAVALVRASPNIARLIWVWLKIRALFAKVYFKRGFLRARLYLGRLAGRGN
jgi:hypothetical protein